MPRGRKREQLTNGRRGYAKRRRDRVADRSLERQAARESRIRKLPSFFGPFFGRNKGRRR